MEKETFPQGTLAAVCNELEVIKKALADLVAAAAPIIKENDMFQIVEIPFEVACSLESAVARAQKVL